MSDPLQDEDMQSGTAAERTFLAWTRTGVGLVAGGVAIGRISQVPLETEVGIGLVVSGLLFWGLAGLHYRRAKRHIARGEFVTNVFAIRAMALITLIGAVAAFFAALRVP